VSFLALPYSLYLYAVLAMGGFLAAVGFVVLSPLILTVQYLRYRRPRRPLPLDELEGG
jgi:hypothetical protein